MWTARLKTYCARSKKILITSSRGGGGTVMGKDYTSNCALQRVLYIKRPRPALHNVCGAKQTNTRVEFVFFLSLDNN